MFTIERIKAMSNECLINEYRRSVRLGIGFDHPDALNLKKEILERMKR